MFLCLNCNSITHHNICAHSVATLASCTDFARLFKEKDYIMQTTGMKYETYTGKTGDEKFRQYMGLIPNSIN